MAVIVTAEDHERIRAMTTRSLQRAGYRVVATANGADALDAVREHHPDAVITDVDMPCMNGLDLCRAIRDDPDLCDTPILIVSGSIHPNDPERPLRPEPPTFLLSRICPANC